MSWKDDFLFNELGPSSSVPIPEFKAPKEWSPFSDFKATQSGDYGFGGTPPAVHAPTSYAPVEKGDLGFPVSGANRQINPASKTRGDLGASFSEAVSDQPINLGNAVPYLMERPVALADQLGEGLFGKGEHGFLGVDNTPILGGKLDLNPLDIFIGGVQKVADVAGPVLDYIPNTVRDYTLNSRVTFFQTFVDNAHKAGLTSDQIKEKLKDPANAAWGGVNLPENVLDALIDNPNLGQKDIDKLLDEGGRQWSYDKGPGGMFLNLAATGVTYAPELLLGGWGAGALKAGVAATKFAPLAVKGAEAITWAAKAQKASLAVGGTVTALSVGMDTIARYQGDQAALDWWDKVNKTHPISDDPNVQLVTSFTVNPLAPIGKMLKGVKIAEAVPGIGGKKVGILPLAHGMGNVVVDVALGNRLHRLYTTEDQALGTLSRMYGVPVETVKGELLGVGKAYENMGEAADEVVKFAADIAAKRLPEAERQAFILAHPDGLERTKAFLTQYGTQIGKVLDESRFAKSREADPIAKAWQESNWQHHNYNGPFDWRIAAMNAKDFRTAMAKTYTIRAKMGAVLGYPDYLAPEANSMIRSELNTIEGDTVSLDWINDVKRRYPAMNKLDTNLIKPGETEVSKTVVEQMLDRGNVKYQAALTKNPSRVKTGSDPVLTSRSAPSEVAQALGTTEQVVKDILRSPDKATDFAQLRQFLADKLGSGPVYKPGALTKEAIAAMPDGEVWSKANNYLSDTTDPWYAAGRRAENAQKEATRVSDRLAQAEAAGDAEAVTLYRGQLGRLQEQMRLAHDPVTPYSESLAIKRGQGKEAKRDTALMQAAINKLDAQDRLAQLGTLQDGVEAMTGGAYPDALLMVRKTRNGNWGWAGDTPPLPDHYYRRLEGYIEANNGMANSLWPKATSASLSEAGDRQLWQMVSTFMQDKSFFKGMRRIEEDTLRNRIRGLKLGAADDDIADAISKARYEQGGNAPTYTGEMAVDELGRMAQAREDILSGDLTRELTRRAEMKVPQEYVDAVGGDEWGAVYDPVYQAYTHPDNVARLQVLLASSEGAAVGEIVKLIESDPLLLRRAEKLVAESERLNGPTDLAKYVASQGLGPDSALQRLVPENFSPRVPGEVPSMGPVDDAIIAGDSAVESIIGDPGPVPPVVTETAQAEAAVRARPKRISREMNKRLADAGVDLDSVVTYGRTPVAREGLPVASAVAATDAELAADRIAHPTSKSANFHDASTVASFNRIIKTPEGRYGVLDPTGGVVWYQAPAPVREIAPTAWEYGKSNGSSVSVYSSREAAEEGFAYETEHFADIQRWAEPASGRVVPDPLGGEVWIDEPQATSPAVATTRNKVGEDALSLITWGRVGYPPTTARGLLTALREIESGRASAMGIGDGVLAEAQKVAKQALESMAGKAETGALQPGVFMHGLNPSMYDDELWDVAQELYSKGVRVDDQGFYQYGYKKAPKGALTTEFEQVPGLAEEFLAGRFMPFEERVGVAQVKQALHSFFGPTANADIAAANRARIAETVTNLGGDAKLADRIWQEWRDFSRKSEEPRRLPGTRRTYGGGGNPFYADIRNLTNSRLDELAHKAIDDYYGQMHLQAPEALASTDFAGVFREASSFTRRNLAKLPLGEGIAKIYGIGAHNPIVTTYYPIFRFKLDMRFHGMNFFEKYFLYAGRAGARSGVDEAMFGMEGQMTRDALTSLSKDGMSNTGYPFSMTRDQSIARTFRKEQTAALEDLMKTTKGQDPELMRRAVQEMAEFDPELAQTLKAMGDSPATYVKALDSWYGRIMKSADPDGLVDAMVQQEAARTPAMAELYGKIAERNHELLDDIRETFYGNPNRSQFERLANNYLLFWPISYQFKAAKWLTKVLFDRAGGLPTNAGGAYVLNQVAAYHQRLLVDDPEYADFMNKHKTLLFAAQMMIPLDPMHPLSWSLSPITRDLLFGRTKAIGEIGPVYTIEKLIPQAATELYRSTSDIPIWNQIYPMLTGSKTGYQKPTYDVPVIKKSVDDNATFETLPVFDTSRFGQ